MLFDTELIAQKSGPVLTDTCILMCFNLFIWTLLFMLFENRLIGEISGAMIMDICMLLCLDFLRLHDHVLVCSLRLTFLPKFLEQCARICFIIHLDYYFYVSSHLDQNCAGFLKRSYNVDIYTGLFYKL